MGRKRCIDPVPTVTIHISEESYMVLEGCREGRLHEPKYRTLDRILREYLQYRGILHCLEGEIETRDYTIQDLKNRLEANRRKEEIEVRNV